MPRFRLLFASLLVCSFSRAAELPPPEDTEVWTPIPAKVTFSASGVPSDAIVLMDGSNLDAWTIAKGPKSAPGTWALVDGGMRIVPKTGNLISKQAFGDVQLHVEWKSPMEPDKNGQNRGNSGIFLMGLYEVQVLESNGGTTYVNGQAGSIYKQYPPLVNASTPMGQWQTYDIIFTAPHFSGEGALLSPARLTLLHNGVLVQNNVELKGPTVFRGAPQYEAHAAKLPISLQDHSHEVTYRNIWVREL